MDQAHTLLKGVPGLQRPCDFDLLMFLAKHPRTLMTSEQLARLLGYQLKEIAQSLDVLINARLLTRAQNLPRLARMYVFKTDGTNGGWLTTFVEFASTREGRLALRRALTQSPAERTDGLATQAGDDATATAGGRPAARRKRETNQEPRSDGPRRRKR